MVYKNNFCGENIVGLILSLTQAVCCSSLETACCRWGRDSNVCCSPFNTVYITMQRDATLCLRPRELGMEVQQSLLGSGQCVVQPTLEPWCFFYPAVLGLGEAFFNCFCQLFRALWLNCKECLATAITITTVSLRFVFWQKNTLICTLLLVVWN